MKYFLLIFLAAILQPIFAAPAPPLKPSLDPFYSPPDGWESAQVGDILRTRKASLRSIYAEMNYKNAWQMLVKTSDQFGNATTMVTTIIEPYDADPSKIVSYSIAQDASNIDCSISYALTEGAPFFDNIMVQLETIFIQAFMEDGGYFMVIPDYQAATAAFLPALQSGYATLDSIRAALKSSNQTRIDQDAKAVMVGYSGGSISSSWASMLQPKYAPDLKSHLLGAAMGGLVSDFVAVAKNVDGGMFTGFLPMGVGGLAKTYPELQPLFKDQLSSNHYGYWLSGMDSCTLPSIFHFLNQNFFSGNDSWFKDGYGIFDDPVVKRVVDENTIVVNNQSLVPEIPIFLFHGMIDEIVPYNGSVKVYDYWCEKGIESLEFNSDMTAEHFLGLVDGSPALIEWVSKRFNNEGLVKGCKSTMRLSNLLYPNVNFTLYDEMKTAFWSIVDHIPLGPEVGLANTTSTKIRDLKSNYDLLMKRGLVDLK